MLHSRIVPAFLCVALAHAAVIGVFLTAEPMQEAPRRIRSAAIVAHLLGPVPGQASTAMATPRVAQAPARTPKPNPSIRAPHAHSHGDSRADQIDARQLHLRSQQSATAAAPVPAPRTVSPPAAEPGRPPKPAEPERNSSTQAIATATAAASSALSNAASAARSAQNEALPIGAPKNVPHADCRIAKPVYPELSKRRGETGTASVRFVIGTTGAIDSITLVKTSGFARLDDAALEALRQSTCTPYVENGSSVRVSYVQAFTFGFDGE